MRTARSSSVVSLSLIALAVLVGSVLLWWRPWEVASAAGRAEVARSAATVIAPPGPRRVPVIRPEPVGAPSPPVAPAASALPPFRPVVDRVTCRVSEDGGAPFCGTCRMHEDCAKDEACIIDRKTLLLACAKSDCALDTDCGGDEVCRAQDADGAVKRCVAAGVHYEGERCREFAQVPGKQCQEGLLCTNGFCAVPCDKANPASCKDGTTCTDTRDGPACARDACTKIGCPDGTVCLTLPEYDKPRCFEATFGESCQIKGCPKGEACVGQEGAFVDGVAFQCLPTCDAMKPDTCPKGFVCGRGATKGAGACYKKCDPEHGLMCDRAKHEICGTVDETLTLLGCAVAPEAYDGGAPKTEHAR
jgi:hypothetical protein